MDVEELWSFFKLGLRERVSSPLLLTFSVSWLVSNYRMVLILVGEAPLATKLTLLDQNLYPDPWVAASRFLVDPLLATGFLILVYPFPARWAYEYLAKRNQELIRKRQKIERQTPITREEQDALNSRMREMDDRRRAVERENVELRSELERISRQDSKKQSTRNQKTQSASDEGSSLKAQKLSEEEVFMLNTLGSAPATSLIDAQLISLTKKKFQNLESVRAEYFIDRLLKLKYIDTYYPGSGGRYLMTTTGGRAYLVENKLVGA